MSESKDIVEHLEGFANDAANPGAPILSRYFGGILPAVDLTRSDLLRAIAEIRALRSALRECADDLAGEIDARCPPELRKGPDAQRKYDRDMEPVNRARALLTPTEER